MTLNFLQSIPVRNDFEFFALFAKIPVWNDFELFAKYARLE